VLFICPLLQQHDAVAQTAAVCEAGPAAGCKLGVAVRVCVQVAAMRPARSLEMIYTLVETFGVAVAHACDNVFPTPAPEPYVTGCHFTTCRSYDPLRPRWLRTFVVSKSGAQHTALCLANSCILQGHQLQLPACSAIPASFAMSAASFRNICFSDIDGTLVHYLDDPAQLQEVC
jgi:hypothetical protein